MSLESPFLDAIRDAPEDDLPRLVFADWLDENGQPERAEFIRVQCELAKASEDDARRPALQKRSSELEKAYGQNWVGPLPDNFPGLVQFARGLVNRVGFILSRNHKRAPVITPLGEIVARGVVTSLLVAFPFYVPFRLDKLLQRMTNWPALRSLRDLHLGMSFDPARYRLVERLVRNPHLGKLTRLKLGCKLTPDQLARLSRGKFADSITRLGVRADGNRREWCHNWVRLPFIQRLTAADLASGDHDDNELTTLLSAGLPCLTELNLAYNHLTDRSMTTLARWPGCRQLHKLDVQGNRWGSNHLTHLDTLPAANLRELHLGGGGSSALLDLAEDQWQWFVISALAERISTLSLTYLAPGAFARQLGRAVLPDLRSLSISNVELGLNEFRDLVSADWFSRLRYLSLSHIGLTDAHADVLLRASVHERGKVWLYSHEFTELAHQKLQERFGDQISIGSATSGGDRRV